jgi:DNA segregation ATPase FtsK/SpoIIIE-like protein
MSNLASGNPEELRKEEEQADLSDKHPASDLRPPKQRYKESAAASPARSQQREKRPLSDILDAAESDIVAIADGDSPSDYPQQASPARSDEEGAPPKQLRHVDSLIRNLARPHKPRIEGNRLLVLARRLKRVYGWRASSFEVV